MSAQESRDAVRGAQITLAFDVWMAVGLRRAEFDGYLDRNGLASTWAALTAALNGDGHICGAPLPGGDSCVLPALTGRSHVHYGIGDAGIAEPLPWVKVAGSPRVTEVSRRVAEAWAAQVSAGMTRDIGDELRAALNQICSLLDPAGGVT